MPHNNHTKSDWNQDLFRPRPEWVALASDWKDPFPKPVVEKYRGIHVVREDLVGISQFGIGIGGKARSGSFLFQFLKKQGIKKVAYVAPRFGFAGISCAALGKMYGIEVHLFMPACGQISDHQMVAIELGAIPHFVKIAAMPVLNGYAEKWGEKNNAYFIPLGLKHELVTAAIIRTAINTGLRPEVFWTAMSTGVLNRALQIAWMGANAVGVAVARNIHEGEKGRATIISHPKEFAVEAEIEPSFPSASQYDLKAWEYARKSEGDVAFWNVAGNVQPKDPNLWEKIHSQRAWGDLRDLA